MKKYEFTGEEKNVLIPGGGSVTVYQIRAIQEFNTITKRSIQKGTVGGWIQSEDNLRHEGVCWVDEESTVYEHARVSDDAFIERSVLSGYTGAGDGTYVTSSRMKGDVVICDKVVLEESVLSGDSIVSGWSHLKKSRLHNVKIMGSKIKQGGWLTCVFQNVNLSSKKTNICFLANCEWTDVSITGEKLAFEAETTFEDVKGEGLGMQIDNPLTLKRVKLSQGTDLFTSGRKKDEPTVVEGVEGEDRTGHVCLDSTFLTLSNTTIQGSISAKGRMRLMDSQLQGFSSIVNESKDTVSISRSTLKDVSSICIKDTFDSSKTIEGSHLSSDEELVCR